ncbi:hypothetical protein [Polyangium aurulentum]|uniref:hypothetical protein n=1 Tax=Polyangium aurulentum TaxID=2567896 RepID=UPI0010AE3D67|nr:hypothetical protein [Polyangium aurulentum]UQA62515.1 hypothetical protein E8A73_019505 [Polyangium aurulentum]
MSPSELLRIAGDAAGILEAMGYTAVARLRDGTVTLELWRVVGKQQLRMQHVVDATTASPQVLAHLCSASFRVQHRLDTRDAGRGA